LLGDEAQTLGAASRTFSGAQMRVENRNALPGLEVLASEHRQLREKKKKKLNTTFILSGTFLF